MEKITITIQKEIYKKLAQMKLDRDLKTFDEVLSFILNNQIAKTHRKCKSELNNMKNYTDQPVKGTKIRILNFVCWNRWK